MSQASLGDLKGLYAGMGLAVLGTFLFALKSIFIKLAYAEGGDAELVLLLRMLMAAPFYLAMWMYLLSSNAESRKVTLRSYGAMLGLGFLGYYLASYLDLLGLEFISAQLERLTLFTYPAMVAILAAICLKEKLTRWIVVSLVLCYMGLWLMYGQELELSRGETVRKGVFLVLGSALSYSVYVILAKPMIKKFGSKLFTSVAMLGSSMFVMGHVFSLGEVDLAEVPASIYGYCALLAFLCTVLPSYMITAAIGKIGATKTTLLGSVGPVFTIVIAVFTLGEPFGWMHLLGVMCILSGVALVSCKAAPPTEKIR